MKGDADVSTTTAKTPVQNIGTPRYLTVLTNRLWDVPLRKLRNSIVLTDCRYSAPEILRGEMIERRDLPMTDIYSLGLIVYEVWSECESFSELNQLQMIEQGIMKCYASYET